VINPGRWVCLAAVILCGLFLIPHPGYCGDRHNKPERKSGQTLATVDGEAITVDELRQAKASPADGVQGGPSARDVDEAELLRRLINVRLVVHEAKRMGLADLPEIKKMVDVFAKVTLREMLLQKRAQRVRVNENAVNRLADDSSREARVSALLFNKEEDGRQMVDGVAAGKKYEELSAEAVSSGKAMEGDKGRYLKLKDMAPEVREVISAMKPVSLTPPIKIRQGFAVIRLEDIRVVRTKEEQAKARQETLKTAKIKALGDYNDLLLKKYTKIHRKLLDSIDFDAKEPGFAALLKDKRILAEIKGEAPITVADLAEELRMQLFHGVERAAETKKINAKKRAVFGEMLTKKVLRKEALRLGLDRTAPYLMRVREYEDSVVFGTFVQKAVASDIKLREDDVRAYYEAHLAEYTLPEMIRISSLAFRTRADGEKALEKLRAGADFQWLLANADGQVDKSRADITTFQNGPLTVQSLPEGFRKAIFGAKNGEARLHVTPDGTAYVLYVQEVLPSSLKTPDEAREEIANKLFGERLKQALDDYINKLAAAADIKIHGKS
jgi:parvulin-like peptidyl-prolyl isomerase